MFVTTPAAVVSVPLRTPCRASWPLLLTNWMLESVPARVAPAGVVAVMVLLIVADFFGADDAVGAAITTRLASAARTASTLVIRSFMCLLPEMRSCFTPPSVAGQYAVKLIFYLALTAR